MLLLCTHHNPFILSLTRLQFFYVHFPFTSQTYYPAFILTHKQSILVTFSCFGIMVLIYIARKHWSLES